MYDPFNNVLDRVFRSSTLAMAAQGRNANLLTPQPTPPEVPPVGTLPPEPPPVVPQGEPVDILTHAMDVMSAGQPQVSGQVTPAQPKPETATLQEGPTVRRANVPFEEFLKGYSDAQGIPNPMQSGNYDDYRKARDEYVKRYGSAALIRSRLGETTKYLLATSSLIAPHEGSVKSSDIANVGMDIASVLPFGIIVKGAQSVLKGAKTAKEVDIAAKAWNEAKLANRLALVKDEKIAAKTFQELGPEELKAITEIVPPAEAPKIPIPEQKPVEQAVAKPAEGITPPPTETPTVTPVTKGVEAPAPPLGGARPPPAGPTVPPKPPEPPIPPGGVPPIPPEPEFAANIRLSKYPQEIRDTLVQAAKNHAQEIDEARGDIS